MIRYFTLVVLLIGSLNATAQIRIEKGIFYAENDTHIKILQALAKYYQLKLDLKAPEKVYQYPIHMTMPLTDFHSILCALHYNTGMCYTLKNHVLTVDKTPAKQCKCKCPDFKNKPRPKN